MHYTEDATLSLKAKGLLALGLRLLGEFDLNAAGNFCKDGRDARQNAFQELKSRGYASRRAVTLPDGTKSGYVYHFKPEV